MPERAPAWQIGALQQVCIDLLEATSSSRTTIRLVERDGSVRLVAEARAPGVVSMVDGPQPSVVAAPTYQVLIRDRVPIYQSDTRTEPPAPPASLVEHYRVWAQMLAPVEVAGDVVATISVHQQDQTRVWSRADRAALATTVELVTQWCQDNHRFDHGDPAVRGKGSAANDGPPERTRR